MIEHHPNQDPNTQEGSFDESMAALFVLITHHSLTQCDTAVPNIVECLNDLCDHSEVQLYPKQMKVLIKMRQLWRTRLFRHQLDRQVKH